jgi:hypothetical protein
MTFAYHCLSLGSGRGEIEVFIVAAVLEAIAHTYTACGSRKLFLCGVWSVYASSPTCASCIEWVYVCVARSFTSTSLYPLPKSLFVHFSISPLGQVISPVLCSNHVCVYVVLCVCMYVWWGSSLWIVAGMYVWW